MNYVFAIPLEEGKLCSHFGHCQQFAIINVEDKSIKADTLITPPPHEPGLLPGWLADMGVTNIIAGGMGQRALDLFEQNRIDVNYGAQSKTPKELVQDWLDNTLQLGDNSCDH
ncbi:MAG: NifB/NifX family molybdenum-iron cluster-binding protein [Bacteroidales bacterium]|nr:NifB/NifX family molybdenum-iron cluster-binding protein [Bacteroidales bacterium]